MTPSAAIQHTRCWLALTAIKATLAQYRSKGRGKLDAHIAKVERWADTCVEDVRRKKASAGALREVKAACDRMQTHMSLSDLEGDALFMRWAASVWAALTLLEDCRNTCPAWFKCRHWRYLLQTMTTLGLGLYAVDATVAEVGTRIYEEVAA